MPWLLNFAIALVLSNVLCAKQFGVYVFATSWATLLAVIAVVGAPTLITGRLATHVARSEFEEARGSSSDKRRPEW